MQPPAPSEPTPGQTTGPFGELAALPRALGPVALVGAGAVATAVARRCMAFGVPVATVTSRTDGPAHRLADAVGARVVSLDEIDAPAVLLCVPDDALTPLADALAGAPLPWTGRVVAHTSGVHTAALLAPLARRGAATLSLHPPVALPPDADARALDGARLVLEGSEAGVAWGTRFAAALGLGAPLRLDAHAKARYHLALSVASNFTVTLVALAAEILGSAGVALPDALALVRPLVSGTAANLAHVLPERALTGPIVRGDAGTIGLHLGALHAHLPALLPAYAALAAETVRVAVRSGRLSPAVADTLLAALAEALHERADDE